MADPRRTRKTIAILCTLAVSIAIVLAIRSAVSHERARAKHRAGAEAASVFAPSGKTVLIRGGAQVRFTAQAAAAEWTGPAFDDSGWTAGKYPVEEKSAPALRTRAAFEVANPGAVKNVFLSGRWRGAIAVFINGAEVYRSTESSKLVDLSAAALPAIRAGKNLFAASVERTGDSGALLLAPSLSMNRSPVVTRGPYLQLGTPTGIVVRWRTELPLAGVVRYGVSEADLSKEATEAAATAEHIVPISGLTPATPYYYSVGGPPSSFVTAPPAGSEAPFRVWVLGDSGTAKDPARAVRDAYEKVTSRKRTDLWLMLGDNAYPDGTDRQYQAALFRMYPSMLARATLWPAVGNHDAHSRSTGGSGVHGEIFTLPARGEAGGVPSSTPNYYAFDWGNAHFISLDSCTDDRSPGGPMLTWLRADLAAARAEWLVAYFHHAPYAKGSEDSDRDRRMTDMRSIVLPLLEEAGVDLVMGGHSHDYERSFLLDGHYGPSGAFAASMKRDAGDGREDGSGAYSKPTRERRPHQGTVYVVAGSSGHTGSGPMNHPAMFTSQKVLGSVMLEFHGDRLDESFIDSKGEVKDHFTILKGVAKK